MDRKNMPWPEIPEIPNLDGPRQPKQRKYVQEKQPENMSAGADNSNPHWRHYHSYKDGLRQRNQYVSSVDKNPDRTRAKKSSLRFEIPLTLLLALTLIFSAFAFYRSNQVYVALDQISSNLLTAIEESGVQAGQVIDVSDQLKAQPSIPTAPVDVEVTADDPFLGVPTAPVTLVEFSDFQCPFCQSFVDTTKQILETYGDQVRLVYRDFPLSIHDQAEPAAIAAQCSFNLADNETFFEYHDLLFDSQSKLGEQLYLDLAAQVGLDQDQFATCLEDDSVKDEVQQDFQDGLAAGVQGTPTTFVNGNPVSGAIPFEQIKAIIDQELGN